MGRTPVLPTACCSDATQVRRKTRSVLFSFIALKGILLILPVGLFRTSTCFIPVQFDRQHKGRQQVIKQINNINRLNERSAP